MKTKLHATRNALKEKSRSANINLLNQQLADVIDLGLQAKQAHWNVKGPHFIGLHELFDKVAEELEEFTDGIAERAVELGGIALGTIQVVSKNSCLKAYPLSLVSGREHISALSGALAKLHGRNHTSVEARNSTFSLARRAVKVAPSGLMMSRCTRFPLTSPVKTLPLYSGGKASPS